MLLFIDNYLPKPKNKKTKSVIIYIYYLKLQILFYSKDFKHYGNLFNYLFFSPICKIVYIFFSFFFYTQVTSYRYTDSVDIIRGPLVLTTVFAYASVVFVLVTCRLAHVIRKTLVYRTFNDCLLHVFQGQSQLVEPLTINSRSAVGSSLCPSAEIVFVVII